MPAEPSDRSVTSGPETATQTAPGGPLWTRHLRRELQFALDLSVLAVAFVLAYLLRFDFQIPEPYVEWLLVQLPVVMLVQFLVVLFTGMYQYVWRYVGMSELLAFLRGAVYSAAPLVLLRLGLSDAYQPWRIPLSVILMDTLFAFGGLLALRVLRRGLYERYERVRRQSDQRGPAARRKPVLLVGAGRAGVLAVKEIKGRGDMDVEPVGFVDDDPLKRGTVIQGLKVLGATADLPTLVRQHAIDHVIITIAAADAAAIRRIVETCERCRTRVRIIPGLYEILAGRIAISRFRDIQIEDLLGREPVRLDDDELRAFLTGKSVLVSGAGGSIGAELCRQAARFEPRRLALVERAEAALFEIDRELRYLWPNLAIEPLVADVGDAERMRAVLADETPQVILHAAAHKHVPMMERHPEEAVKNNVVATHTLGRLAGEVGVEAFVLISTDKAVRPASVMGASKRLAELVVQGLDAEFPASRFLAVRFGNVMGSTGSVIPIFRQQIARGGPVTVTHPDVQRYFMTPAEAAQLVLEAGAIGRGGEILILDMGQPVRILQLAEDMITLSGFQPYREIPIEFTGLRPGEKLFEELQLEGEAIGRTRHPKIFVGRLQALPLQQVEAALARLEALAREGRSGAIRDLLHALLPEATLATRPEGRAVPNGLDTGFASS